MPKFSPHELEWLADAMAMAPMKVAVKMVFFEACLFMEGQSFSNKKKIARYYAERTTILGLGATTDLHTRNFSRESIKKHQILVDFLEEKLLQNTIQLSSFKQILTDLQSQGYGGSFKSGYHFLSKIEKNLPQIDFRKHLIPSMKKMINAYKKNRPKTASGFLWHRKYLLVEVTSFSILNFMTNTYLIPICASFLIVFLCITLEAIYVQFKIHQILAKELYLEYSEKSSISSAERGLTQNYELRVVPMLKKAPENKIEKNNTFPSVELFPENITPKFVSQGFARFKLWATPDFGESKKAAVDENKMIFPDYFGPAFEAVPVEDFKKLEGGSFGPKSQLYGMWYGVDKDIESDLYDVFCEGELISPKENNGIKQLKTPGRAEKYYEIKCSGTTARVLGKEFGKSGEKSLIVFVLFDSGGLHGANQVNQRMLDKVDLLVNDVHTINSVPALRMAM